MYCAVQYFFCAGRPALHCCSWARALSGCECPPPSSPPSPPRAPAPPHSHPPSTHARTHTHTHSHTHTHTRELRVGKCPKARAVHGSTNIFTAGQALACASSTSAPFYGEPGAACWRRTAAAASQFHRSACSSGVWPSLSRADASAPASSSPPRRNPLGTAAEYKTPSRRNGTILTRERHLKMNEQ